MTVLRMLAEGKINADEAARLLEALGEEAPKEKAGGTWEFPFENMARGAQHFMRHAGKAHFHWPMGDWARQEDPFQAGLDTTPQRIAANEGMALHVHNAMGSIKLMGTDESQIVVEGGPRGQYRVDEKENAVRVQAHRMGAELKVRVPAIVDKVVVHTNLGEIEAQNLLNDEVELSTNTGEIEYEAGPVKTGSVRLRSDVGSIRLRLAKNAACEVRAASDVAGEVTLDDDTPLQVLEQGSGFLHAKLNDGGADIRAMTHTGEIHVEVRE